MRAGVEAADASPTNLAYLEDRVRMFRGEPQLYGTQFVDKDGSYEPWPIEDPDSLDDAVPPSAWVPSLTTSATFGRSGSRKHRVQYVPEAALEVTEPDALLDGMSLPLQLDIRPPTIGAGYGPATRSR